MIVMLAKSMLETIGCEVVGVPGRVKDALSKVDTAPFDVAMLDVNLAGVLSYPVAAALKSRGKQFMFTTSYGVAALPPDMQSIMLLSKPYVVSQLRDALVGLSAGGCG
jgi:CheY-like chemotaxis protein